MHICFLMYPWERVCPETDTTLRLVHECAARGHAVAITTTSGLTIRDSTVYGFCNVIKKGQKITDNIGKCSFRYHDLLDELMNRGWLKKLIFLPTVINQDDSNTTLNYLIDSLAI